MIGQELERVIETVVRRRKVVAGKENEIYVMLGEFWFKGVAGDWRRGGGEDGAECGFLVGEESGYVFKVHLEGWVAL